MNEWIRCFAWAPNRLLEVRWRPSWLCAQRPALLGHKVLLHCFDCSGREAPSELHFGIKRPGKKRKRLAVPCRAVRRGGHSLLSSERSESVPAPGHRHRHRVEDTVLLRGRPHCGRALFRLGQLTPAREVCTGGHLPPVARAQPQGQG